MALLVLLLSTVGMQVYGYTKLIIVMVMVFFVAVREFHFFMWECNLLELPLLQ